MKFLPTQHTEISVDIGGRLVIEQHYEISQTPVRVVLPRFMAAALAQRINDLLDDGELLDFWIDGEA